MTLPTCFKNALSSVDLYSFAVPENAAVGATVGKIRAQDGDIGINARMTYSLEDDLEESSTFLIKTDPVTQEGVILLAKVHTHTHPFASIFCHMLQKQFSQKPHVGGAKISLVYKI